MKILFTRFLVIMIALTILLWGFLKIYPFLICYFVFSTPVSSKADLIENYQKREHDILELCNYFNKIVPYDKEIEIELTSMQTIDRLQIINKSYNQTFTSWEIPIKYSETDSLLQSLHWTPTTLSKIHKKLQAANCISVSNSEPFRIGFQRSGLGMYFYNIFEQPLNDSLKIKYNDGCTYILYNDRVVLEYGGGAIGPQCFPQE